MLGMSRTVSGARTVSFEYLRIETRPDGIYYVAHPRAKSPGTDFKLVRSDRGQAVFENPSHDFLLVPFTPRRTFIVLVNSI